MIVMIKTDTNKPCCSIKRDAMLGKYTHQGQSSAETGGWSMNSNLCQSAEPARLTKLKQMAVSAQTCKMPKKIHG